MTARGVGRWVMIAALVVFAGLPLLYMLLLSVRDLQSVVSDPLRVLPEELRWSNYLVVFQSPESGGYGMGEFMLNSLLVAGGAMVLTMVASVLGAYAVARLNFPGRRAVAAVFFGVYLFPVVIIAVPLFVLFARMGLRGSLVALMVIYLANTVPVALYMLRNHFEAVPRSIEEAAFVDGCGRLGVVLRVVLPLSAPSIASTALYVFVVAWNEFLFAFLFLVDSPEQWTVSVGLSQLTDQAVPVTVLMAGSVALTVPVVLLFFMAQRFLVSGLTAGGEKG